MTLIDCPQCGKRVLSVASTCPKCGFSLSEQRKKDSLTTKATLCRSCQMEIAPKSQLCPHCGEVRPSRGAKPWPIVGGIGLVLLVAALLITWRTRDEPPEPMSLAETVASAPDSAVDSQAVSQVDSLTASQMDSQAVESPPMAPAITATASTTPAQLPATRTKWTVNWANVRAGPSNQDSIVRVLLPGQQVEVDDQGRAWWLVYLDGQRLGFVSRSLLADSLPDSLATDTTTH